jgi:Protein of unknown function (DUF429)
MVVLVTLRSARYGAVANETGVAVIGCDGAVVDAGWTRGVEQTLTWIVTVTAGADALVFVDAPLVVDNPSGQRACERQVGQCYGRWQVSANTTNTATPRRAGVRLRERARSAWLGLPGRVRRPAEQRAYPFRPVIDQVVCGGGQGLPARASRSASSGCTRWLRAVAR